MMIHYKKKYSITLSLLLFLIGFANGSEKDSDGKFIIAIINDQRTHPDSVRVITVVESKIYNEISSLASDYVPLFNYLTEHHNEEFDESISLHLYQMFSAFPDKHSEFEHYLKLLPICDQKAIITTLTLYLFSEFAYEESANTVDEFVHSFWNKFPFLKKYDASRKEVEQYCAENPYPFD